MYKEEHRKKELSINNRSRILPQEKKAMEIYANVLPHERRELQVVFQSAKYCSSKLIINVFKCQISYQLKTKCHILDVLEKRYLEEHVE